MINYLLQRFSWTVVKIYFTRKEYHIFLEKLERHEANYGLAPYQHVMRAVALLINGSYKESADLFQKMYGILENYKNPDEEYLRLYCKSNILALKGQVDCSQQFEEEMMNIRCNPELVRILPYR